MKKTNSIQFLIALLWRLALIPIVYRSPFATGFERTLLLIALSIWTAEVTISQIFIWLQAEREQRGKKRIQVKNSVLEALLYTGSPAKTVQQARLLLVTMPVICVFAIWLLYLR